MSFPFTEPTIKPNITYSNETKSNTFQKLFCTVFVYARCMSKNREKIIEYLQNVAHRVKKSLI